MLWVVVVVVPCVVAGLGATVRTGHRSPSQADYGDTDTLHCLNTGHTLNTAWTLNWTHYKHWPGCLRK